MIEADDRSALKRTGQSERGGMNEEAKWQAVLARDEEADGIFVYAVMSTGIYCRPSCPSRRPKRENVAFFDLNKEAETAGFRPCKRCKPQDISTSQKNTLLVEEACRILENADDPIPLDALANRLGVSSFHFHRLFKRETGVTPAAYGRAHRTKRLSEALTSNGTVTQAIFESGYQSTHPAYRAANGALGMSPTSYKAGGHGQTINVGIGTCTLGKALVAGTSKGICAILIGDDDNALRTDLEKRFPNAVLKEADDAFEDRMNEAIAVVDGQASGENLPLDIQGTAFQIAVWQQLQKIPAGETQTYTEIARRIGKPEAVRAVANACGANPTAVAIPCHRIVRTDGSMGGYRWGLDRKQTLLARESQKTDDFSEM